MYTSAPPLLGCSSLPAGITTRSFSDPSTRKIWLQHILDTLVASKQGGQPLMGVMFWQAALSSLPDWDGYNIYLDGGAAAGRKLLRTGESVTSVIRGSFGDEQEQGLMRRIVGLVTGQGGRQEVAREGRQLRVVQVGGLPAFDGFDGSGLVARACALL
jgi:hypothetical protein